MKKTHLGIRVYCIAEQYNIPQTTVHTIINSYAKHCKERLLNGEKVDFYGLVTIIPNVVVSDYKTTLAYECEKIADSLALPRYTVYVIIKEYLTALKEDLLNGVAVDIRGIVSIKPIYTEDKLDRIHSLVSTSLKEYLLENDGIASTVRVHTFKTLKADVSNLGDN